MAYPHPHPAPAGYRSIAALVDGDRLGEIAAAVGQPLDAHPIIEGLSQLSFYDGHLSAP